MSRAPIRSIHLGSLTILPHMADRFFTHQPLNLGPIRLDGPEAHHLAAVRRFREGDQVTLFNGDGREYPAAVVAVERKAVDLDILSVESPDRELPHRLVVASALPKGDRAEWLVEKLTELGVAELIPLQTERSIVHPGDGKLQKLERIVIEASKQCGRNRLMQITPLQTWPDLAKSPSLPERRLIAQPGGQRITQTGDAIIAIGPEGGFSPSEIQLAEQSGWRAISLGPTILRIETAALAAAVLLAGV